MSGTLSLKEKLLITGSNGKIGSALAEGLAPFYDIVEFDLPGQDATDYRQLCERLAGCYGVVHLAFDLKHENSRTGANGNPENLLMGQNVLAAAAKLGVQKCIMASSVNAARTYHPTNWSYRTTKLQLERLAGEQALRFPGTDFVSIRFGRVTKDDQPPMPPLRDDQTWLSHRDAAALAHAALSGEPAPAEHVIVYGVSDRPDPPYDLANPWGWSPQDRFGYDSLV